MPAGNKQKPQPSLPPFTRLPPIDEFPGRAERAVDLQSHDRMTGEITFNALKNAVEELTKAAPNGSDVLVVALGLRAERVEYVEPHTVVLHGQCVDGTRGSVIAHYTQLIAQVIQQPKRGAERMITAFVRSIPERR